VNRWKELVEIWHVDGVIIIGMLFVAVKKSGQRQGRYDQNLTFVKIARLNFELKFYWQPL